MKLTKAKVKRFIKTISIIFLISLLVYNILYIYFILSRVKIDSIKSSTNSIKVVTYNVEFGLSDLIYNQLLEIDADIVALQEATWVSINSINYSMDEVANLLNMKYLAPGSGFNQAYGLVIFSKWEILASS
ncbi:MAG: endonuclease/exonuclease/phosphatase family protein, partial [Candidatus Kariarchaeaceae archaeon]